MLATQRLEKVKYQMAQLYLSKLRAAEAVYRRGHENCDHALAMFDHEWLQIKHWWDWSTLHVQEGEEIATLCQAFSLAGGELLVVRLPARERLELLEAGLAAARLLHDEQAEMVHLYLIARTQRRIGPYEKALDTARQALDIAQRRHDRLYIGKIYNVLGGIFFLQSQYEPAQQNYEQALAISQALGEKHEMGLAVGGLGNIAHGQGDFERARRYDEQYLAISEANGQPYNVCMALRNMSMGAGHMGDDEAAVQYAERCVALCEAIGFYHCLAGVLIILGDHAYSRKDFAEAERNYLRGLEISRQINHRMNEAFALVQLGRLYRRLGDMSASREHLESAFTLSEAIGDSWYSANALLDMTTLLRITGDTPQAFAKFGDGLEIMATIESSPMQGLYLLEAAWLWHEQGQTEQAAQWIGSLEENFSVLPSDIHAEYYELYWSLESELGQTAFAAALEAGKVLDLGRTMQTLREEVKNWRARRE